jgi:hypothetical protein
MAREEVGPLFIRFLRMHVRMHIYVCMCTRVGKAGSRNAVASASQAGAEVFAADKTGDKTEAQNGLGESAEAEKEEDVVLGTKQFLFTSCNTPNAVASVSQAGADDTAGDKTGDPTEAQDGLGVLAQAEKEEVVVLGTFCVLV